MPAIRIVVAVLLLTSTLRAQDMPLAQILIPGENWTKVDGVKHGKTLQFATVNGVTYQIGDDRIALRITPQGEVKPTTLRLPLKEPAVLTVSPDRGTMLIGVAGGKHVWLYRIREDGSLDAGEKYIELRVLPYIAKTLKERTPQEPGSGVTAIDFDKAGRIYVATAFGVQVFDPTGRLCGVLTSPEDAPVSMMSLVGDQLHIDCGKSHYQRKLNTTAATKPASK